MKKPPKDKALKEDLRHPQGDHYKASMHPAYPMPQNVDGGDMQMEPQSGSGM